MTFMKVSDFYFLVVLVLVRVARWTGWPGLRNQLTWALGCLACRFSFKKRRAALQGLERVFASNRDKREKRRILCSSFRSFWQDTFAVLPFAQDLVKLDRIGIVGEELLRSALEKGRGAILLESNAFGQRLTAKQLLGRRGFRIFQIHAENHLNGLRNEGVAGSWLRRKVLKTTFERWEKEFVFEIVDLPQGDSMLFTRTLQRRLAANSIVCSAGDGSLGQKFIKVPFLGRDRPFATGLFSLSKICRSPILPLFCFQEEGDKIKLVLGPEHDVGTEGVEEALVSFAQQLEGYIRRYPGQYRNWQF